jgi:5-(carboxyamino)imidazole ribonucleotide synthase
VGVLALELFEVGGRLLGNELAPRVHNSGHWTIDAARCSQFENHCRAIAGLPLGDPTPIGPAAMVNFIGAMPPPASVLALPATRLHDYAKQPRPGRKVGHTNVWGPDAGIVESSTRRLLELARDAEADVSANAC